VHHPLCFLTLLLRALERARVLTSQLLECQERCRGLQLNEAAHVDHVRELTDSMRTLTVNAVTGKQAAARDLQTLREQLEAEWGAKVAAAGKEVEALKAQLAAARTESQLAQAKVPPHPTSVWWFVSTCGCRHDG
jgi:hypothetical protein